MNSIDIIFGPTASGKSELAMNLAQKNPDIEIVNADASLIYIGFDIGTAKPTSDEQKQVRHHIIDICLPDEHFDAAKYMTLGQSTIREIIKRGKIPLVVGGSGLYVDALFNGLSNTEVDPEVLLEARSEYFRRLEQSGFNAMVELLKAIDKTLYDQVIREQNPRRLQRAWEYHIATGRALGEDRKIKKGKFEYIPSFILLDRPISILRERITSRVDSMLDSGWIDEVKSLRLRGIKSEFPAMKSIGYKTLFDMLDGKGNFEEAREDIILKTGQYAKRQRTWLNKYLPPPL